MGNINELDNLLNQIEEIKKQIENFEMEIQMGDITNDEEMKKTAQSKMAELNNKKSEIEEKIKIEQAKEQEKSAKKKELEEKYPNQKTFHRAELASEEELQALAEQEATPNRERKAKLEEEKENLKKQKEELVKEIDSIKAEFMKTHDKKYLKDAENIVEKFEKTNQAIEKNAAELEKVGPTEYDLEEFRAGMINDGIKLGTYVKPGPEDVINYLQDKLKSGKSAEEIAKELNDYAAEPKADAYSKYIYNFAEIAEIVSNLVIWIDVLKTSPTANVYEQIRKEIDKAIKGLETAPYDFRINIGKDKVIKALESIKSSQVFDNNPLPEKANAEDNKKAISRVEIEHTKNLIDMFKAELAFNIMEEGFVPSQPIPIPSRNSVEIAIEDFDEICSREKVQPEDRKRKRDSKINLMAPINQVLNEVTTKIAEEKRDIKQQVIDAVTKNVNDGDGEIQPEDIENYLILQEFIEEQREIVKTAIQNGEDINAILEDKTETKGNTELQEMLNEVSPEEKTEEKAENKIY